MHTHIISYIILRVCVLYYYAKYVCTTIIIIIINKYTRYRYRYIIYYDVYRIYRLTADYNTKVYL